MKLKLLLGATAALGALGLFAGGTALASSHSDAPLIKLDPQANLTDVYAFIRQAPNNGPKSLVVGVAVRPFSEPGDGVTYESFSDDARYSIHIANPTTGVELQRYDFKFSPVSSNQGSYKNLNTILRYGRGADKNGGPDVGSIQDVGDAHQNYVQTYSVTKVVGNTSTTLNNSALMVPPYNTGLNATPFYNDMNKFLSDGTTPNPNYGRAVSGATSRATLDKYTRETTYDLPGGQTVFAGAREDGFYADIPGIFDLLDSRILSNTKGFGLGQDGTGVDGFKGFNTLYYAITIPLSQLPASSQYTGLALKNGAVTTSIQTGIGVYASVSRPRITLRSTAGDNQSSGPYIQVNREANPLFNEGLVAIKDKDNYNRDLPTSDATKYKTYALNPELAVLINATYGTNFATTGRIDLALVFIPDVIRVETTVAQARITGETGYSRLGAFGGDGLTNSAGDTIPGGWPNGRRFGDDVVDIALTAIASGPSFSKVTLLGDNVNSNDQIYNMTFPYAGTPNGGTRNSKDSGPNVGG